MLYVYRFLWPLRLGWLLVLRFIYKFFNVCHLDYTAVAGSWKVGPVNQVYHTSWVTVVTPTDLPKSVRNLCVIELFVALFVLSLCPFDISVGVGAFVIGLSQISSFFLLIVSGTFSKLPKKGPFYCINHIFSFTDFSKQIWIWINYILIDENSLSINSSVPKIVLS